MLRTRRSEATHALTVARTEGPRGVRLEFAADRRLLDVEEALGVWRGRALAALPPEHHEAAARTFRVLAEVAGADLPLLLATVDARLGLAPPPPDLDAADRADLDRTPPFDGEAPALDTLRAAARADADLPRPALLERILETEPGKCVVFASYPGLAARLADALRQGAGEDAVALISEADPKAAKFDAYRFASDPACRVLVADRSGEEGLNLQHASLLVHYDLPLRPNRLEQRMGRLDRIGRETPLRTRVLLDDEPDDHGPTPLAYGWFELLRQGLGLFDGSIADLQFFVERAEGAWLARLLEEGGDGLIASIPEVAQRIDLERSDLAAQDALDALDLAAGVAAPRLEEDAERIQTALHGWALQALHFKESLTPDGAVVIRHRQGESHETLVPRDMLLNRFLPATRRKAAYDRRHAIAAKALPLRTGHPFFDALAAYADWDDRGRAFVVRRKAPPGSPYAAALHGVFQFDVVVQGTVPPGQPDHAALRRRADRLLPPTSSPSGSTAPGSSSSTPTSSTSWPPRSATSRATGTSTTPTSTSSTSSPRPTSGPPTASVRATPPSTTSERSLRSSRPATTPRRPPRPTWTVPDAPSTSGSPRTPRAPTSTTSSTPSRWRRRPPTPSLTPTSASTPPASG